MNILGIVRVINECYIQSFTNLFNRSKLQSILPIPTGRYHKHNMVSTHFLNIPTNVFKFQTVETIVMLYYLTTSYLKLINLNISY